MDHRDFRVEIWAILLPCKVTAGHFIFNEITLTSSMLPFCPLTGQKGSWTMATESSCFSQIVKQMHWAICRILYYQLFLSYLCFLWFFIIHLVNHWLHHGNYSFCHSLNCSFYQGIVPHFYAEEKKKSDKVPMFLMIKRGKVKGSSGSYLLIFNEKFVVTRSGVNILLCTVILQNTASRLCDWYWKFALFKLAVTLTYTELWF